MNTLLALALGTFVSEDLACIAAGVLVMQHRLSAAAAIFACATGIFAGDMLLFIAGRLAWRFPRVAKLVSRWIPPAKFEAASSLLSKEGFSVVLLSRFTPGLRLPTYVAAGLFRCSAAAFAGYFLLAALVWTPVLVLFAAYAAKSLLAAAAAAFLLWRISRNFELRRRAIGFLKRKIQWEFWPVWAAYLPLAPYLLFLAVRHRSLTLFTAANPGIESGGFAGESKSEILRKLSSIPHAVAEFRVVRSAAEALPFATEYPLVLKPDAGQRGSGVSIVHSERELREYTWTGDIILQRYVPGCEFGVYYVRYPHEAAGRIVSITEKRFPQVTGDGLRTVRELILEDPRAVCLAETYLSSCKVPLDEVPARARRIPLVEIGSHCRGAVFLNGIHLHTEALAAQVDRIAKAHPGFHLGRFDVRAPSLEAFQRGEFQVIELNGVTAEPTHIYDPEVSLFAAYRAMAAQWRMACEIGAMHRADGVLPMSLGELIRLIRGQRAGRLAALSLAA
ncbi:MAG: VTT domain-containing protein [Bryobacteraceae bacterium]|nr:VTT domain-containing protein [Bryobacteraceae bacterium]